MDCEKTEVFELSSLFLRHFRSRWGNDINKGNNYKMVILRLFVLHLLNHVRLFAVLLTVAPQVPLSMGFPRQEYWSELPFPFPGALPDSGIKAMYPGLQMDSLPLSHAEKPQRLFGSFDSYPFLPTADGMPQSHWVFNI